mgnify:CR=1 FL=1
MRQNQPEYTPEYQPAEDTTVAVLAESLYLINLLLLPGLAFVLLLVLYRLKFQQATPFTLNHLQQTLSASIWAGILIIIVVAAILILGGFSGAYTWMIVILYFTIIHASLIILGMIGLVKALAGQCWSYPLIGRARPEGC